MLGWEMFVRALRDVFGNLWQAVLISAFWGLLLPLILAIMFGFLFFVLDGALSTLISLILGTEMAFMGFMPLLSFLIILLVFLVMAGMAIQWHRLVLQGERLKGFMIFPRDGLLWRYAGYAIVLGIGYALLLGLFGYVIGIFSSLFFVDRYSVFALSPSWAYFALDLACYTIAGTITALFSLVLPAAALSERMTLGKSFQITAPYFGSVFVLVLAMTLLQELTPLLIYLPNQFFNIPEFNRSVPETWPVAFFAIVVSVFYFVVISFALVGYLSEMYRSLGRPSLTGSNVE